MVHLCLFLTFKTFDEVIERANDNDLGLCSYLYTNSMDKAHIGSEKLESGCVAVNTGVVALLKHHLVALNKLVMDVKVDLVQLKIT